MQKHKFLNPKTRLLTHSRDHALAYIGFALGVEKGRLPDQGTVPELSNFLIDKCDYAKRCSAPTLTTVFGTENSRTHVSAYPGDES